MPEIPEELDVFRRPHFHMKQLVKDIEAELSGTNFTDSSELRALLNHLHSKFKEFKCHEEIENQYIVKELLPRLPSDTKTTLDNDIHSDSRLNDLVTLVDSGLQPEACKGERERVAFGEQLKLSIANFTIDFIPHMDEEEEVFLPLLLEYFSEAELRQLTLQVLELHQLPEEAAEPLTPSLLTLPPEVLLKILSYLSPRDLLRLTPLHSSLHHLTRDTSLWQHLHPVRWARGHWEFFEPPLIANQELVSKGLIEDNDVTKELLSVGAMINANLAKAISNGYDTDEDKETQRELCVLQGIVDHVLPRVGSHVLTLDLSHSKAASNEVVFHMLRRCPNLKYLDLSYTNISDFAFRGLLYKDQYCRWQLEHLDLSGCVHITDTSLQRLAQALTSPSSSLPSASSCSPLLTGGHCCGVEGGGGERSDEEPHLKCLILSGCYSITDVGLRSLSATPGLPRLHYLNLSGLPNVTPEGLSALVAASPSLPPDLLFYCENISAGPYFDCANGCQNVGSSMLQCCRQNM